MGLHRGILCGNGRVLGVDQPLGDTVKYLKGGDLTEVCN